MLRESKPKINQFLYPATEVTVGMGGSSISWGSMMQVFIQVGVETWDVQRWNSRTYDGLTPPPRALFSPKCRKRIPIAYPLPLPSGLRSYSTYALLVCFMSLRYAYTSSRWTSSNYYYFIYFFILRQQGGKFYRPHFNTFPFSWKEIILLIILVLFRYTPSLSFYKEHWPLIEEEVILLCLEF